MLREANIRFIGELVKTWITDLNYTIHRPTEYRNDQKVIRQIIVQFQSVYRINISDSLTKSRKYVIQLELTKYVGQMSKDKVLKVINIEMDYNMATIRKQFELMVLDEIESERKTEVS